MTASGDDEASFEDEFRDWAEEAAAGPTDDAEDAKSGWMGRMFGRKNKDADEAGETDLEPDQGPSPEDLEDPDPEELGVFPAVNIADVQPADPPPSEDEEQSAEPEEAEPSEDTAAPSEPGTETEADDASAGEVDRPGAAGTPSFAELWGPQPDDDLGDEAVDFSSYTSDDYLQATTREYAGLAEAVARAEEEDTQQIAVAAEIPGLESGIVGLEDVVSAEAGAETTDVIEPPAGSDLSMRVLTAVGLLVLFGASLLSPYGIGALIFAVLGIAAGELFAALIRGNYRPLSLFGFFGIAGAFIGTWVSGPVAIPIALLLTAVAVFLFYATVPGRRAALENATLTIMVTAWIGGLGAFAFDLLGSDDYVWLVLALVVTVAAMDVGQYFIGRRLGRRQLAPVVSPKKTVEGYVAGVIVAIAVGAAFAWAEPFEMADGLLIGAVVAIVSPLGDLAVSVVKRALGVKDMGYILPGHGGVLDRVDAMVITIPALWIAYSWMGLLN
jgi:phosphatidate cytidylyltransferase